MSEQARKQGIEAAVATYKVAGLLQSMAPMAGKAMQFASRNPRMAAGLTGGAMAGAVGAIGGAAGAQPGNRLAGAAKGGLAAGALGAAGGAMGMNHLLQGGTGSRSLARVR